MQRYLLFVLLVCIGCDDASDESAAPEDGEAAEESAPPAHETAPEANKTTDARDELETTTGFIEATIGGDQKRFEYLPAEKNTAAANGTFLQARATPVRGERIELSLIHFDVREMNFPAAIGTDAGPMKMAAMNYWDAEGMGHPVVFNGDALTCQSLEELRLTCTFSGTAHPDEGGPVEVTDGRLEVLLTTNELRDRFIRSTTGAGAR